MIGDTDLRKESASVDDIGSEDETILERKEVFVDEISTEDEIVLEDNDGSRIDVTEGAAPYLQH